MQVQINFINKDYSISFKWIFKSFICDSQASSDVAEKGDNAFFTVC